MKNLILYLPIVAFSQAAIGQSMRTAAPQQIVQSFSSSFPSAHFKKWKLENNNYVAEFTLDNKKSLAYYSANGHWLRTETKFKWSHNVPSVIKGAFNKSEFAGWTIYDVKEIQTPMGRTYRIHVNDGNLMSSDTYIVVPRDVLVYFSPTGELVKSFEMNYWKIV